MKRLTDGDIAEMAASGTGWHEDARIKNAVRKSLKIRDLSGLDDMPERLPPIDCHGKTVDDAFGEIDTQIERVLEWLERERGAGRACPTEMVVITGKSGVIKQQFHASITIGYLKNHIKSWKLINDGCYKIIIKL